MNLWSHKALDLSKYLRPFLFTWTFVCCLSGVESISRSCANISCFYWAVFLRRVYLSVMKFICELLYSLTWYSSRWHLKICVFTCYHGLFILIGLSIVIYWFDNTQSFKIIKSCVLTCATSRMYCVPLFSKVNPTLSCY